MGILDEDMKTPEQRKAERVRHLVLALSERVDPELLAYAIKDDNPEELRRLHEQEIEMYYKATEGQLSHEAIRHGSKQNNVIWDEIEAILVKYAAEGSLYRMFFPMMVQRLCALHIMMLKTEDDHNAHAQVLDDVLKGATRNLEMSADVFLIKNDPEYAKRRFEQMLRSIFGTAATKQ